MVKPQDFTYGFSFSLYSDNTYIVPLKNATEIGCVKI